MKRSAVMALMGIVLLAITACSPIPRPGSWRVLDRIPGMPQVQSALGLADGRVLALGGSAFLSERLPNAIFDPVTSRWLPASPTPVGLEGATVTLLADGTVLVAGGGIGQASASAYLYAPVPDHWTRTGSMTVPRTFHTASRLADGRVLVAGGQNGTDALASAEIYDPASQTWAPTGSLRLQRTQGAAVTLVDGRVLLVGGRSTVDQGGYYLDQGNGQRVYFAEIWDPRTGRWSIARDLASDPAAVSLGDGRVLVAGGSYGPVETGETYLFDPRSNNWSRKATALVGGIAAGLDSVTLKDGRALLLGGTAATYDERNDFWAQATVYPANVFPRFAVRLASGRVLMIGSPNYQGSSQPAGPLVAEFDPDGFPPLPGSTGPLASASTVEDLAGAAALMLLLVGVRILVGRRPRVAP